MITEDFVNFEVAKLLREKGFNEYTESCFVGKDWESPSPLTNSQLPDGRYSRPTLQMVMKWLREVYNIYFNINYYHLDTGSNWLVLRIHVLNKPGCECSFEGFVLEEEQEKAIKFCLENLI